MRQVPVRCRSTVRLQNGDGASPPRHGDVRSHDFLRPDVPQRQPPTPMRNLPPNQKRPRQIQPSRVCTCGKPGLVFYWRGNLCEWKCLGCAVEDVVATTAERK